MKYAKNTETFLSRGPWAQMIGALAICPDGKVRKVRNIGPDMDFYSRSGAVKVSGKTVSGLISFARDNSLPSSVCEWIEFTATGKHSNIFGKVD